MREHNSKGLPAADCLGQAHQVRETGPTSFCEDGDYLAGVTASTGGVRRCQRCAYINNASTSFQGWVVWLNIPYFSSPTWLFHLLNGVIPGLTWTFSYQLSSMIPFVRPSSSPYFMLEECGLLMLSSGGWGLLMLCETLRR